MPRNGHDTRRRLVEAACKIIEQESLSDLSVERVSDMAGVSRRTFFTHFPSKDHLLEEVVSHIRPTYLARYKTWSESCGPLASIEERLEKIVECITAAAHNPNWKGSCFIRVSAELGSQTGHPVHAAVAAANSDVEKWLETELVKGGYFESTSIARQLVMMINGLLMMQLVTRSTVYGRDLMGGMMRLLRASDRAVKSKADN